MSLKITILSGGSGNDSLIKGLKQIYKDCDIKVIVNMYDSGKSTGICRKVTNTLGVSDVRKNHIRLYSAMTENPNKSYLEFYNNRYDLPLGNEVNYVLNLLEKWDLQNFDVYVENFFEREEAKKFEYKDFNIANIIYSEMYAEEGYEATNRRFCNLLGIKDFVICNSFDNVYIKAETYSGKLIEDEGDIVNYANTDDYITNILYTEKYFGSLNDAAIERVLNSDLIIISTGTFWSSIYPTLHYLNFYDYINASEAKKIWVMNNEEDKDAYGISSNNFINILYDLGLDMSAENFTVLENLDATDSLRLPSTGGLHNPNINILRRHMENKNGKHDGLLLAKELLKIYYGLDTDFDKILLDFDDTIYSRMANKNNHLKKISVDNLTYLNKYLSEKAIIISGNTYESLSKKLYSIFGTDLNDLKLEIWADANSKKYIKNKCVDMLTELEIKKEDAITILNLIGCKFGLTPTFDNNEHIVNIKIKGLDDLQRILLASYLNDYMFNDLSFNLRDYEARITGTTTVDILHKSNNKSKIFNYLNLENYKTLYIGDEIEKGNDCDIAKLCTNSINVSGVEETNVILKLLGGAYEKS